MRPVIRKSRSGRIPAYSTTKVFTSMIKRYSCSKYSQSFEKYFAPFETFNTVECFLCKGAARVVLSPNIKVQFEEEPFLGFGNHVIAGLFDLANE
jgi:hypothetical protein